MPRMCLARLASVCRPQTVAHRGCDNFARGSAPSLTPQRTQEAFSVLRRHASCTVLRSRSVRSNDEDCQQVIRSLLKTSPAKSNSVPQVRNINNRSATWDEDCVDAALRKGAGEANRAAAEQQCQEKSIRAAPADEAAGYTTTRRFRE